MHDLEDKGKYFSVKRTWVFFANRAGELFIPLIKAIKRVFRLFIGGISFKNRIRKDLLMLPKRYRLTLVRQSKNRPIFEI